MRNFLMAAAAGEVDMSKYFEWGNSDYSIGNALLIAVLGIAVVFVILTVLVLLLSLFAKIFSIKRKKTASVQTAQPRELAADDGETVAAIIAAVGIIYAEESGGGEVPQFKIRRIKQVGNRR